ncbi:MAG TPA: phosphate ABC transporter substrate-binding protein [Desulfarculaceae bacterium]|nr:phosphate ABC transporter substrate-binding protein [Desulfarculaceae bacterium]
MLRKTIISSWLLGLLLGLSFLLASQVGADSFSGLTGQSGTLRISGGTAHIPVMKEASGLIMRKLPEIRISVAGGGSGVGIKQVGEGLVDIGNSGRKPTANEVEKYGLILHLWALDGVGVIVNQDNPVRNLSAVKLQDIFSGRIDNWNQLGWIDKKITLITRDQASGTRKVFWKKALRKSSVSSRALVVSSNGAMKSAVLKNPYAIGYASIGYLNDSVAAVALDGVAPTMANVRNGSYPVVRGLYSNTRGLPHGLTESFIGFLYSPAGQEIILSKGLIPVAR